MEAFLAAMIFCDAQRQKEPRGRGQAKTGGAASDGGSGTPADAPFDGLRCLQAVVFRID